MFGICILAIVPVRLEPNHRSEMVSQLLFGEHFSVLEKTKGWVKIKIQFDNYEGWIDEKQFQPIAETEYQKLSETSIVLSSDLIEYVTGKDEIMFPIPLGSSLSSLYVPEINTSEFVFDGLKTFDKKPKSEILKTAFMYLNTPYLWGGKTPFGIDCSGFVQMVYKLNGYSLFRDAHQQATQGEVLSFIEEAEAGDLAFFDNEDGKITHVGILMNDNYIIHAHGKVRVDRLDHLGIMNVDTKRHTHKLRVIKKVI